MALDAAVGCLNVTHSCWIQNVAASGMRDMLAAGAVAFLAANVPFCDLLGANVVVHGMAAVASGTSGSLHVVGRVVRHPPVGTIWTGGPDTVPSYFGWKIGQSDTLSFSARA